MDELFVGGDLRECEVLHGFAVSGLRGLVPVDEPLERGFEAKVWSPAKIGVGFAGVEAEVGGFVDAGILIEYPGSVAAPEGRHLVCDPGDGLGVVVVGAEVVGSGEFRIVREQLLGEEEVAVERLEHVLPGADRVRVADADGLAGLEAADEVGDEAVGGPVAAADDVAGAGGGEGDCVLGKLATREIGLAVGGGDDLGAGLGAGVGIVAAERIGLAVGPEPFLVLVALVGGDDDDGADGGRAADGSSTRAVPMTLVS